MKVMVMDAQGGGMGKMLVDGLKKELPQQQVIAVGTNAMATAAMLRAGADQGATGENAVVVCAAQADVIVAPIGMILADAMLGEVTAPMAVAIGKSAAHKVLVPVSRCQTTIAGLSKLTMAEAVSAAVQAVVSLVKV